MQVSMAEQPPAPASSAPLAVKSSLCSIPSVVHKSVSFDFTASFDTQLQSSLASPSERAEPSVQSERAEPSVSAFLADDWLDCLGPCCLAPRCEG